MTWPQAFFYSVVAVLVVMTFFSLLAVVLGAIIARREDEHWLDWRKHHGEKI